MKVQGQFRTYTSSSTFEQRLEPKNILVEAGNNSHRRTKSLDFVPETNRQESVPSDHEFIGVVHSPRENFIDSSNGIIWDTPFASTQEKAVWAIYNMMPTFDSTDLTIVNKGAEVYKEFKNLRSATHGSRISKLKLPSELTQFPENFPGDKKAITSPINNPEESNLSGEVSPWNWEIQSSNKLVQVYDTSTINGKATNTSNGDHTSMDIHHVDSLSHNFSPQKWVISGEVCSLDSLATTSEPQIDPSIQHDDIARDVNIPADKRTRKLNRKTGTGYGSRLLEQALSPLKNDYPLPVFYSSRDSRSPSTSFELYETGYEDSCVSMAYLFPFPSSEEIVLSLLDDESTLDSLVLARGAQHTKTPDEVRLGYPYPQIPRNNPTLSYFEVEPPCPAAGRPPISDLVGMTQFTSGLLDDMNAPRSWWHYFYRSVVPSHLFQNSIQPSIFLPPLDHWSIDVEFAENTRPPSPMTKSYAKRQERRLKRAICRRKIGEGFKMLQNIVVTGLKMAVAVILWMFRWCGLGRSSAGWYG